MSSQHVITISPDIYSDNKFPIPYSPIERYFDKADAASHIGNIVRL